MFELVKRKLVKMDDVMAAGLLLKNTYACQRNKRPWHIKNLQGIMESGLWVGGHVALARRCFNGGEQVLVNGQQTAEAVVNTGIPVDVTYSEYDCHDEDDVASLYGQFDPTEGARTVGDCVKAKAYALKVDWCDTIRSRIASAAAFLECKTHATRNDRVEILGSYLKEGDFINSIMAGHTADAAYLNRASVYIAMILTMRRHRGDAEKFWTDIRDGEGLKKAMPQQKIRDYLMQVTVFRGRGASSRRSVTDHEIICKCIAAWNAYRRGESTCLKYYPEKPIPKAA
jgi:hypothetical protein